jgi:hypothetical protein
VNDPPDDSLLLNDVLRARIAIRENWGYPETRSFGRLVDEAQRLELEDIFLIARAAPEEDPLDHTVGVATWPHWETATVSQTDQAPILAAAWRAMRFLSDRFTA